MRIVDGVTLAQRVEAVALTRMKPAGVTEGIVRRAMIAQRAVTAAKQREIVIDAADVERRDVNDEFGAANEGEEFLDDVGEALLIGELFVGYFVYFNGTCVFFSVLMEVFLLVVVC